MVVTAMTNNEAYWTERALKRAEEAYLHDAALTAKLFQEYESAAKAIKREISAFYSKYAGKYGLTYDQAVRLLNRKEFQEWKASLAEYVDYIATIQDPKVKALLTAQLDALSANSSISRLEALQGQIDLILNDLFDKGVAQMKNQFGDDFVEGYYKKCYDLQSRAGFFNEIAKIDYAAIENVVSYTVTDAQAATQTITVTEKLTNGTQTITLRTYTATSGAQNTVDLSSVWLPLLSGTHVLTITATDSTGGSATRKITFSRTVSRIAAARAFNTDALVQKVFVSLYPATIPADATLHLEVTNNPFDTSPVWVDITDKANRLVHVFTNTTAAKGYGLGYRFYITKGTQEIEITQATIRFA